MKKIILSILAVLLICAMLFASCTAADDSEGSNESNEATSVASSDDAFDGSLDSSETDESGELSNDTTDTTFDESEAGTSEESGSSQSSEDASEPNDESEAGLDSSADSNESSNTSSEASNASQNESQNSGVASEVSDTGSDHFHFPQVTIIPPTCTEQGFILYACEECDQDREIIEYLPVVPHNIIIDMEIAPTQTARGKYSKKCSYNCGYAETGEYYSYNELGRLIAGYALQYINEYRVREGAPKLITSAKINEFCEYRAQQALQGGDHVGHNRADGRLAAEATKFGVFCDYTHDDGRKFWSAEGQEAWTSASYSNNDCIKVGDTEFAMYRGQYIANLSYASKPHWAYVGGASSSYKDFIYAGIGLSAGNCYIVVCDYNPDEMGYRYSYYDENGNLHEEWVKP